jgi:hypothetical protein
MVGGTQFHCRILHASLGGMSKEPKQRQGQKQKLPRRKRQNPSLLHVSLDNADTVIEGGPYIPDFGICGAVANRLAYPPGEWPG